MNVSNNNYANAYESKLTVVLSKLRSLSGKDNLTEEEKEWETRELKAEKKQLQKKIDTEEHARRKEELKELMGADEAVSRLSTVNVARANLTSSINVATSQYETDKARGVNADDKEKDIEKLNDKLNTFTENIVKQMSKEDEKRRRIIISEEEEESVNDSRVYKGIKYRRKDR